MHFVAVHLLTVTRFVLVRSVSYSIMEGMHNHFYQPRAYLFQYSQLESSLHALHNESRIDEVLSRAQVNIVYSEKERFLDKGALQYLL